MDKLPQSEIKYENKITKWFHNYWYYYKWKVIIAAFLAFVVVICSVQMCNNTKQDIEILYAGQFPSSDIEVPNIRAAFEAVMPYDYNDDGKRIAALVMLNVYSEEQIKKLESESDGKIKVDRVNNNSELDKFQNLIVAGSYHLCILEPWLYEIVKSENGFVKLSDALGYTPDIAVDEYAVRLSDTEFGRYYAGVKLLPEDTYICLRAPGGIGTVFDGSKNKKFDMAADMLQAVLDFKAPQ